MSIIMVIIVAISLSMDAFSLSLAYGTLNLEKKYINVFFASTADSQQRKKRPCGYT